MLNYGTEGEGEDLVILHGWGCDITLFESFKNNLKDKYRVTLIDLPGHGKSAEPETAYDVYEYAEAVREFLIEKNITSAYFFGHSFGCRLIIILASKYPELVKRAVLTGAAGIKDKRSAKYYFKVYSYKAAKLFLKTFAPKKLEEWKKNKGSEDYKKLSDNMRASFSKVVNEDLTYLLKSVTQPVFLIWGETDTATPLYMSDIMVKEMKDAAKTVYMGRGHYAFLEEAGRTLAIVRTFFKE